MTAPEKASLRPLRRQFGRPILLGTGIGAADLNGDGYTDLVVGEPGVETLTGRVHLYLGSAAGLEATPIESLLGPLPTGSFGQVVAGAADTNGDGHGDVVIGAQSATAPEFSEGLVYLFLGGCIGPDADRDDVPDECDVCPDGEDGVDTDGDGWFNDCDVCPGVADPDQADADGDGVGDACVVPCVDEDGDGSCAEDDCDDLDPTTYPGAPERCDGRDNFCAGVLPLTEIDTDLDGYRPCTGDCDDADRAVSPSAVETCGDGVDNDCDVATTDECEEASDPQPACGCGATPGAVISPLAWAALAWGGRRRRASGGAAPRG